jgi:PiT family inorganic phosphate transporter
MHGGNGINWGKAKDIGLSLLLSPAFGFTAVILVLFMFKYLIRSKEIFKDPSQNENRPPPWWIRGILIITCTLVSFFHGNNDGQKGVGIMMVVLLALLPGYYALNPASDITKMKAAVHQMKDASSEYALHHENNIYAKPLSVLDDLVAQLDAIDPKNKDQKLKARKNIQIFSKSAKAMLDDQEFITDKDQRKHFVSGLHMLKESTDFAPVEAILLISLSLGFGTMVGWKRIVITIGEKIGKTHLTYAQGAAAELVAAATIGMSSGLGLPVSTTHVLSSGIAGSMVGIGGFEKFAAQYYWNYCNSMVTHLASDFRGITSFLLSLPIIYLDKRKEPGFSPES